MDKIKGVISALKNRSDFGAVKKGVSLLGIVQKLTEKRKASSEKVETPAKPEEAKPVVEKK